MTIVFKISLGEDTRRISFERAPSFADFVELVRKLFKFDSSDFTLKYEDDEKDQISITSDLELGEAIKFFTDNQDRLKALRLYLFKNSSLTTSSLNSSRVNSSSIDKDLKIIRDLEENKLAHELAEMKKAQEELARKSAEEVRRKQILEEEEKQRKAQEELAKKVAEEERKRRLQEEEEATRRFLEEEAKQENGKKKNSNSEPILKEYLARNGDRVKLDISMQALAKYGVAPFARIQAPNGPGTIVGVDLNRGHLWFKMDQDNGVSFWDDIVNHDSMVCKGISPLDPNIDRQIPYSKKIVKEAPPLNKPTTSDEEWEKQMLEKAIQESLLDQEQKRIKSNYSNFSNK